MSGSHLHHASVSPSQMTHLRGFARDFKDRPLMPRFPQDQLSSSLSGVREQDGVVRRAEAASVPVRPRLPSLKRRGGAVTGRGDHVLLSTWFHGSALGILFVVLLTPPPVIAGSPAVEFDTDSLVCCQDVTTDEFAAKHPEERLLEVEFDVTAMVNNQLPEDTQYEYRFLGPAGQLKVVDYKPKTERVTMAVGNVSVERKKDSSKSLGISVSGSFESLLRGNIGSDIGSKRGSNIKYELKPPTEVVLVAGTVARGTGVYFKLRSSPNRSLEGSRNFVVVMRAPQSWRGDVMYVRCEARRKRLGQLVSFGVSRFIVGLHVAGDQSAKSAAQELVLSEMLLRRIVDEEQQEIQQRAVPSLAHKVGTWFDVVAPRIPDSWLDRIIYGSTHISEHDFYSHLPQRIRRMANRYRRAKQTMYQLNGSRANQHVRDGKPSRRNEQVSGKQKAVSEVL